MSGEGYLKKKTGGVRNFRLQGWKPKDGNKKKQTGGAGKGGHKKAFRPGEKKGETGYREGVKGKRQEELLTRGKNDRVETICTGEKR